MLTQIITTKQKKSNKKWEIQWNESEIKLIEAYKISNTKERGKQQNCLFKEMETFVHA